MTTTADLKNLAGEIPVLMAGVMAGNEVIVMKGNEAVARIVPVGKEDRPRRPLPPLKVRSLARPRVLTPIITGSEIAEDMFSRE